MKKLSDELRRSLDGLAPSSEELMELAKRKKTSSSRPWGRMALAACLAVVTVLSGVGIWQLFPGSGRTNSLDSGEIGSAVAKDYEEILDFLRSPLPQQAQVKSNYTNSLTWSDGEIMEDSVAEGEQVPVDPPAEPAPGMTSAPSEDRLEGSLKGDSPVLEDSEFSDTNVQHEGLDEADVVKTDGKAIYLLRNNLLSIIPAQNREPAAVHLTVGGSEKTGDYGKIVRNARELYLVENRLVVLLYCYEKEYTPDAELDRKQASLEQEYLAQYEKMSEPGFSPEQYLVEMGLRDECGFPSYYEYNAAKTVEESLRAVVYDVSKPSEPLLLEEIGVSGSFVDTRVVGNVLYLVARQEVSRWEEPASYLPSLYSEEGRSFVDAQRIYLSREGFSRSYLNLLSYDVERAERLDALSVLGAGSDLYASYNNLYVLEWAKESTVDATTGRFCRQSATLITRISYQEGKLTLASQAKVEGAYENSFFFDERNDCLRLVLQRDSVSCEVEPYSSLAWIKDWVQNGGWDYIAYGNEKYRAVRGSELYLSDTVLLVLDLSLRELGRLEGLAQGEDLKSVRFEGDLAYFVTYLQVDPLFAVDLSDPRSPKLLGELKVPGYSEYLQPFGEGRLLGFGVSDVGELKLSMFDVSDPEAMKELVSVAVDGAYGSDALYNHKALLADPEKKLIGFATRDGYWVYSYGESEEGAVFTPLACLQLENPSEMDRGIYVGDLFFCLGTKEYAVYYLENLEECYRETLPQPRVEFTVDWNGNGRIDP